MYFDPNAPKLNNDVQIECEYPGHTMMVALAIMLNFENYQEARSKGNTFTKAAESGAIPGAGCAVWKGLDALKHGIENDLDAETMVDYCNVKWEEYAGHQESYKSAIEPGNKRAEPFIEEFTSRWNKWKQESSIQ